MVLSELWIYPVKSLGGIRLKTSQVQQRGLQYDRRWMIVDDHGSFLTQRTNPKMASLGLSSHEDGFTIFSKLHPGRSILLPFLPDSAEKVQVKIWKDIVDAVTVSSIIDAWLSQELGKMVRLVFMPESTSRMMHPDDSPESSLISFTDDFPFLLISQASLDDLNSRLDSPVTMQRFRPNLVVSQTQAFGEDSWKTIKIGHLNFLVAKPCDRCVLINVNPELAVKETEPLKTLAGYRKIDKKIFFGQNVIGLDTGIISEGDSIHVLK